MKQTAEQLCLRALEFIILQRNVDNNIDNILLKLKNDLEKLDYSTFSHDANCVHSALIDEFPSEV